MGVLLLPRQVQTYKTSMTCCHVSELLDPLIENTEGKFLFVSLGKEAVVNNDIAEKGPFWNKFGEFILTSDFFLFFLDVEFNLLQQVHKLGEVAWVLVDTTNNFGDVVFGLLLGTWFFELRPRKFGFFLRRRLTYYVIINK